MIGRIIYFPAGEPKYYFATRENAWPALALTILPGIVATIREEKLRVPRIIYIPQDIF